MFRRALIVLPLLLLLCFMLLFRSARATGVLDQSNTAAAPFASSVSANSPQAAYQVVTAGATGALDTVALDLSGSRAGVGATVAIYSVDAGGNAITLLASTTVSNLPTAQPSGPSQYSIATFGAPATVLPGERFAIVVLSVQPSEFGLLWFGQSPASYGGGHSFECFNFPSVCETGNASSDFETFVTPPPPATPSPSPTASPAPSASPTPAPAPAPARAIAVFLFTPSLTLAVQGCGTTTPPAGPVYGNGLDNVLVTAVACPGSVFTGWSGGPCAGTLINPCDIAPTSSTITAEFAP